MSGEPARQGRVHLRVLPPEGDRLPLDTRGLLDALEASTCAVNDTGRIVFRNRAWRAFSEANGGSRDPDWDESYLDVCDRVGLSDDEQGVLGTDRLDAGSVAAGLRQVLAGSAERYEHEYPCHAPQAQRWFSVRVTPWAISDQHLGALITHVDVTEMHLAQTALSHLTLHDALTGLANRTLLRDRLRQGLLDSTRRDTVVGVGVIGLDFFKGVNSSHGQATGDALLERVGRRLSEQLRGGDTLARLVGDEFVVVWRDLETDDQALGLSERLLKSLADPFELEDTLLRISASIGVATSRSIHTIDELIHSADAAMHVAKRDGRGRARLFSPARRRGELERATTEADLQSAITASQLVLHYQPTIDLRSGAVVGLEALVRWEHPTRGLLPPADFIPIAEASGLVVPLGRWVLGQACADAATLTGVAEGLHVAVNLSARQLGDHDVVSQVRQALTSSGLDPRRLVLEVTESAIVEDEEVAAQVLEALSAVGVQIAIDDFGTGFSSLLYLRRYPIDSIKIDRAFVAALPDSKDDHAICTSVVGLANAVRATCVAEGVETVEQYAAPRLMGCHLAQGYLWSPAVPLADLGSALAACRQVPQPRASREPKRRHPVIGVEKAVHERMLELLSSGASLHTIAAALNAEGASNARGMRWSATTVAHHLSA